MCDVTFWLKHPSDSMVNTIDKPFNNDVFLVVQDCQPTTRYNSQGSYTINDTSPLQFFFLHNAIVEEYIREGKYVLGGSK